MSEVLFCDLTEQVDGHPIPGVSRDAFLWHKSINCGPEISVTHVGTGLLLLQAETEEVACGRARRWWRSLPEEARDHFRNLTTRDIQRALVGRFSQHDPNQLQEQSCPATTKSSS